LQKLEIVLLEGIDDGQVLPLLIKQLLAFRAETHYLSVHLLVGVRGCVVL
jgi:hypothetical protein